uniref:TRAP transporter large permease n=1 Tax=Ndongobacter massiliensis TaxID=1871025 RepID=UPI0009320191|nr:TRAP transporter large permease [Ndongobacter massiliensis]
MNPLAVALIVFMVLMFLGMPIVFVMTFSSLIYCLVIGKIDLLMVVIEKMFRGMDSFVLLAIPMFIMCGEVMNRGGITSAIVSFADLMVGRVKGGLAYVNTLASTFFAGITGSALSDIASIGSILIPAMEEQGYTKDFSCAVTAATAIQGPLIPPSIPAVLVASATGLSTGALFWGGAMPGLLIGIGSAIVIFIKGFFVKLPKRTVRIPFREAINVTLHSILPLMTVVIILVGMNSGIFTPTEAAAIALAYALCITSFIYKPIPFSEFITICKNVLLQTTTIYLIIAGATTFSYVLATENIPTKISMLISSHVTSKLGILMVINLILLVWGMFMDTAPSILVLVPILFPVAKAAGVNSIHFGVLVITNLMVGMLTPPFGMAIYTTQSVGKCRMGNLIKQLLPFIVVDLVILGILTIFPSVSLFLPQLFGFVS